MDRGLLVLSSCAFFPIFITIFLDTGSTPPKNSENSLYIQYLYATDNRSMCGIPYRGRVDIGGGTAGGRFPGAVRADLKSNHLVTKRCPLLPWNSGVAAGVLVGLN